MRLQRMWAALLLGFVGLNVWAMATGGGAGFIAYLRGLGPYGLLATVDLLLALGIGVRWMWIDARRRGVPALPYAALTALTGSVGLLAYLAVNTKHEQLK